MKKVSTWMYTLVQPIASFLLKIVYQPKIINKQVIPKEGRIILAGNHKMLFDPVLVSCGTRRTIHFLAKDVFFTGIRGFFMRHAGTLPVHVGKVHKDSFKSAIDILNKEKVVGIFPEGTRNYTEKQLLPFKRGAVTLAQETNSKIIPFAIYGRYLPFHGLRIEFGEPININGMDLKQANQLLEEEVRKLLVKAEREKTGEGKNENKI